MDALVGLKDDKKDLPKYLTWANPDNTWTGPPELDEFECIIDYIFYLTRNGVDVRTSAYSNLEEKTEKAGKMISLSDHSWVESNLRIGI